MGINWSFKAIIWSLGLSGFLLSGAAHALTVAEIRPKLTFKRSPIDIDPPANRLRWEGSERHRGETYYLERASGIASNAFEVIDKKRTGRKINVYDDRGLEGWQTYLYRVKVTRKGLEPIYSNTVSIQLYRAPPPPFFKSPSLRIVKIQFNDSSKSVVNVIPHQMIQAGYLAAYLNAIQSLNMHPYTGIPIDFDSPPFRTCRTDQDWTAYRNRGFIQWPQREIALFNISTEKEAEAHLQAAQKVQKLIYNLKIQFNALTEQELKKLKNVKKTTYLGDYFPKAFMTVNSFIMLWESRPTEADDLVPVIGRTSKPLAVYFKPELVTSHINEMVFEPRLRDLLKMMQAENVSAMNLDDWFNRIPKLEFGEWRRKWGYSFCPRNRYTKIQWTRN